MNKSPRAHYILELITGLCIIAAILLIGLVLDIVLTRWGVYEWAFYWLQHIFGV